MRHVVLGIGMVVVGTGIAGGLLVLRQKRTSVTLPVAHLVPSCTTLLIEVPDWHTTQARWGKAAFRQILLEPEVEAFLQRPLSKMPGRAIWDESLELLHEADVRQAFFAVAKVTDNMPHSVGGFGFRGTRRDEVEKVIAKIRARGQAVSPTGKSDLVKYHSFEIESFSGKGVTVAGAFANDWYFFGNDIELLKETLDRFAGNFVGRSLADDSAHAKSMAQMPIDADFRFFANASGIAEKILTFSSMAGRPLDPGQAGGIKKVQAIAGAIRIEEQRMHDTFFVLHLDSAAAPVISRSTLALTSLDTLFYYAFAPEFPRELSLPARLPAISKGGLPLSGFPAGLLEMIKTFSDQGVRMEDFRAGFEPEFAAFANWPTPLPDGTGICDVSTPAFFIAGKVRNATMAQKFTETLCASAKREEGKGVTYWRLHADDPASAPTVALTKEYVLLGLNQESVKSALSDIKTGKPTLRNAKAFTDALGTVGTPGTSLLYLDARPLFEHVYDVLRPMAMIWANFVPHAGDYVQMAKLPASETISKQLLPMVLSSRQIPEGTVVESSGSLTFFQIGAAMAAVTGAAAVPVIEGKAVVPGVDSLIDKYFPSDPASTRAPAAPSPSK